MRSSTDEKLKFKVGQKVKVTDRYDTRLGLGYRAVGYRAGDIVTIASYTGYVGDAPLVTIMDGLGNLIGDASGFSENWFDALPEDAAPPASEFERVAAEIGHLVAVKNEKYGNSHGNAGAILKVLYPDGVKPEQYDDMTTVVRILDKLQRIATDKDAFGESPYADIAGYGILGVVRSGKAVGK